MEVAMFWGDLFGWFLTLESAEIHQYKKEEYQALGDGERC
jgi:hypothetical protein